MGAEKIGEVVSDFLWFGIWPWVERKDGTNKKANKSKEGEGTKGKKWEDAVGAFASVEAECGSLDAFYSRIEII